MTGRDIHLQLGTFLSKGDLMTIGLIHDGAEDFLSNSLGFHPYNAEHR